MAAENPERIARRQFWEQHRPEIWERIVASLQPDERWRSTSLGFEMKSLNHDPIFRCPLICQQCIGWKNNGQRCTRSTCKMLPLCHSHALSMYNVEVKESNHGSGLFAKKRRAATPNELPLFRQNDFIADYLGERLPHNQFHQIRYPGDITASYAWENPEDPPNGPVYDGACIRGLGAYANSPDFPQQPNATLIFSHQRGWPIIVALQDIRNGQEILISYGENYQFNDAIHETRRRRIPETQMFFPYTVGMNNYPNWQIQDFIPAGFVPPPPPPPPEPEPAPRAPARRGRRRRRTGRYRSRTTKRRKK